MLVIIKDDSFKRAILTALGDQDMLNILNASQEQLVSGRDIMKLFDISHSTTYRKIKWMLENDLLVVEKMQFTDDGKKYSLFKSAISSVNVKYDKHNVTVEAEKNANIYEGTTERFFSLGD